MFIKRVSLEKLVNLEILDHLVPEVTQEKKEHQDHKVHLDHQEQMVNEDLQDPQVLEVFRYILYLIL